MNTLKSFLFLVAVATCGGLLVCIAQEYTILAAALAPALVLVCFTYALGVGKLYDVEEALGSLATELSFKLHVTARASADMADAYIKFAEAVRNANIDEEEKAKLLKEYKSLIIPVPKEFLRMVYGAPTEGEKADEAGSIG